MNKIPVVRSGQVVIFLDPNKPPVEFFENFFRQFTQYNTDLKLREQYILTANYCSARAHFITVLLNQYGITPVKVFKTYKNSDWELFNSTLGWTYHCATMVIDANNDKWILDPWVTSSTQLLTPNQWLHAKNEPTPISFLIAEQTIIDDHVSGEKLMYHQVNKNSPFLTKFRLLFTEALPNYLERPLNLENPVTTNRDKVSYKALVNKAVKEGVAYSQAIGCEEPLDTPKDDIPKFLQNAI